MYHNHRFLCRYRDSASGPRKHPASRGYKQHVNTEARCTVEILGSADEQQG